MSASPVPPPGRRRLRRWVLGGVSGLVLVAAAGSLWVGSLFAGGFDDLIDRDRPTPADPAVVAGRQTAGADAARSSEDVAAAAVVTFGGVASGATPQAPAGACEVGAHDWLRDDPYDLRCFDSATVTIDGATVTSAAAVAFDQELSAAGWSGQFTLSRVVSDYGDRPDPPAADYFRGDDRLTVDPGGWVGPGALLLTVTVATSWD